MAHIELVSRTTTSITCRAVNLPDWARVVNWYIGLNENGEYNQSRDVANTTWTFTRLEHPERPGTGFAMTDSTIYYIKFATFDANGVRHDDLFPVQRARFATLWEWDSDVASGAEFSMTAAEFNRFIDLVFSAATAKGISLAGTASSYYVTAGTDMLASQVNSVRSLISALGASVPSEVRPGRSITAAFFNGLVNSLYSIT